jgi:hypothetical protein
LLAAGIEADLGIKGVFANPPANPYIESSKVCPAKHGTVVEVNGFPSSPFAWTPFSKNFEVPDVLDRVKSYCKPGAYHCIDAYNIDVSVSVVDACACGVGWGVAVCEPRSLAAPEAQG